jgi:hypothetical protein
LDVMAWLDRVNVGFAKLQMMTDLGASEVVCGFGAGIVYLRYALSEIPSNLLLERIGARKTFARITILWRITSMATMFVKSPTSFYVLRFLLGSFEAGLFPGVVLYLGYWFPARIPPREVDGFRRSRKGSGRLLRIAEFLPGRRSRRAGPYAVGLFGERMVEWCVFADGIGCRMTPRPPLHTLKTAGTKARENAEVVEGWHDNRHALVTELGESEAGVLRFGR